MTEPLTDCDLRFAIRRQYPECSIRIGSYSTDDGRTWHYASVTADPRPSENTTWAVIGPAESRAALLSELTAAVV